MPAHIERIFERDLMPYATGAGDNRFPIKPAVSFDTCDFNSIALTANECQDLSVSECDRSHVSRNRFRCYVAGESFHPRAPFRRSKTLAAIL